MAVPVTHPQWYFANGATCQAANVPQQSMRIPEVRSTSFATIPSTFSTGYNPLGAYTPGLTHASIGSLSSNGVMVLRKLQDLPEFSGHAEDWPIFFTAFQQSTNAYGYSNLENNQRLQKSLKGEARDTVKSLLIHPENVGNIIEQLRFRFGRPEQLIRSQLSQLREISPISESGIVNLVPFATTVKNLVAFLQSANGYLYLTNPTLIEELVSKLPMSKKLEWARYLSTVQSHATVVHFSDWLTQIANLICCVQDYESREPSKRRTVLHAVETQSECFDEKQQNRAAERPHTPSLKCAVCQNSHKPVECQRLLEATSADRWKEVKRSRLCFSCLSPGHTTRECRRRKPCHIDGCQRMHHKMLHDNDQKQMQPAKSVCASPAQPLDVDKKPVLSCSSSANERKLLFRILPVTLHGGGKTVETYALFDEGSSVTLVDSTISQKLGLNGLKRSFNLQWYGGRATQEPTVVVDLFVSGTGMKKKHKLRNVYSVSNLNLPTQSLSEADLRSSSRHKQKLPLEPYSGAVPKLLIGLDHCHLGIPAGIMQINCIGPYAANTELGWTVFGPRVETSSSTQVCLFTKPASDQAMHDMIAEYFETESFGVKPFPPVESAADLRAKAILHSTTRRTNGRYETGLLWKYGDIEMPDS
ncbi:uncharacterized protein LOC118735734 [Rhagoletis pomonella]|uniref:uncharacterized protein LOC118735734 n=1 Tax=Rhagoletis pomonella TaxID=28610 RepID=UPI00177E3E0B|nr:uncharacterized protein LOC118735734 [Rhagoletis pomonella]